VATGVAKGEATGQARVGPEWHTNSDPAPDPPTKRLPGRTQRHTLAQSPDETGGQKTEGSNPFTPIELQAATRQRVAACFIYARERAFEGGVAKGVATGPTSASAASRIPRTASAERTASNRGEFRSV
jgi:hypothetical protein